jgi:NCS1 family nucleobase:cation symporter-1
MSLRRRLVSLDHRIRLEGDEDRHEQTDAWSNRDLIPLPPERRTWYLNLILSRLIRI